MKHARRVEAFAADLGLALPDAAVKRLLELASLLRDRGVQIGVVARSDADNVLERHVLDSLRAAAVVGTADASAYDLGSGGGLPGLVVAIAAPTLRVGLVEARRRRVAFLELAVESLGLGNASVRLTRIEDLREPVDLCFARALGSIERSWELARPVLRPGGRLVYFAGRRFGGRIALAGARDVTVCEGPVLERTGPLVIMAR